MYSHNFMEVKVNERDKELLLLAESFDRMKAQNENLKEKLGSQEFEMGSLFKCIEHLRQQLVTFTEIAQPDPTLKYKPHEHIMELYKNSQEMMNKLKLDQMIEVKKDLIDFQGEKTALQTQISVVDRKIKTLSKYYSKEMS